MWRTCFKPVNQERYYYNMEIKMTLRTRFISKLVAAAMVMSGAATTALASAYPDKPIKMMIGYAPGSSTDIVGRMIANDLSIALKQPIVVENRGGAAGNIAADAVAKSSPDGYTILFAQNGLAISVATNPKLPFNGSKDLIPVVGVAATYMIKNISLVSASRFAPSGTCGISIDSIG
jgi:tripartite-type tricarboxylate transporter receptor subunit TctC